MGLEALRHISEVLGAAGDAGEEVMLFSPRTGGERIELWRDLVNVRFRQDGYREDVFLRGGTVLQEAFPSENIVQLESFSAEIDGERSDYLFVKTETLHWLEDFVGAHPVFSGFFLGSHRIWIAPIGRYLFAFDPVNGENRYLDMKTMEEAPWLGAKAPDVLDITAPAEGSIEITSDAAITPAGFAEGRITIDGNSSTSAKDYRMEIDGNPSDIFTVDENDNVNDIAVKIHTALSAASDITDDWDISLVPDASAVRFVAKSSGPAWNNVDIALTDSSGGPITVDFAHTIDDTSGGSNAGDDNYDQGVLVTLGSDVIETASIDSEELKTSVAEKVRAALDGDAGINAVYWVFREGAVVTLTAKESGSAGNNTLDYSANDTGAAGTAADIEGGQESSALIPDEGRDNFWVFPDGVDTIYRGYVFAWELNDGSFTIPGGASVVPVPEEAPGLGYRGIRVSRTEEMPSNAVKLHLFATRFQVSRERCFRPSEDFPNGAFFHLSEHEPATLHVDDFTPDGALLDAMSAFIPMVSGIYNLFGPGQLQPNTLMRTGELFCFGGYVIRRPDSFAGHVGVQATGSAAPDISVGVVYEYSDNTRSLFFKHDEAAAAENTLRLSGVNLLLSAVHVYLVDESDGSDFYYVRSVRPPMAEFHGMPFGVSNNTGDYEAVSNPSGSGDNSQVELAGYVTLAQPPQMIRVDHQFPLSGVHKILCMLDAGLDEDRGTVVRRRFAALTDRAPVAGLITASASGAGLQFSVDSEAADLTTPVSNAFAVCSMGRRVFYQSSAGIYLLDRTQVRLLLPADRFEVLDDPVRDIVFHERRGELWILGAGNRGLSVPLRDDMHIEGRAAKLQWPADNARSCRALAVAGERLFAGFDTRLFETDREGYLADDITFGFPFPAVSGSLTSDHLSGLMEQLYLRTIELFGEGYPGRVLVDLQSGRFDSGHAWSRDFTADVDRTVAALSMRGGELAVFARGMAPRLRVELDAAANGRFSGLKLIFERIKDEGTNRK